MRYHRACYSDGEIKRYAGDSEGLEYLDMHTLLENEDYYLGIFSSGAHPYTLGDFHNLLGPRSTRCTSWPMATPNWTSVRRGG